MKMYGLALDIRPGRQIRQTILRSVLAVFFVFQIGCAADSTFEGAQEVLDDRTGQSDPNDPPVDPTLPPDFAYEKPIWEDAGANNLAERIKWTYSTFESLLTTTNLKTKAKDIKDFCPKYANTTDDQKMNFWVALIAALAKYESDFNVNKRVAHESNANDPLTQLPRYKEGLLQVSYQDSLTNKACSFDWSKDRNLLPSDANKTIFDAFKSISCGVALLDAQIGSATKIATDKSYWNSLNSSSKTKKIKEIQAITKALKFCN